MKQENSRRQFLKRTVGILGATIGAYAARLFPESQSSLAQAYQETVSVNLLPGLSGVGKFHGGFVLLPEGAPVPSYVRDYKFGIPTMCNVGSTQDSNGGAIHETLSEPEKLVEKGQFPVYVLATESPIFQSHNIQYSSANLIKHSTGQVFGGWVNYTTYDEATAVDYTSVSIMAQADFPKPFPLWSSEAVEEGAKALILEEVDYLPGGAGVKMDSLVGFTLFWIHHDVYYMLTLQHLPGIEAQLLASSLKLLS